MKEISANELKSGCQISFDEIYPKTIWVSEIKKENWANTIVIIVNKGEYKIIAHHKLYVI